MQNIGDLKQHLEEDLAAELSKGEVKRLTKKSSAKLAQLGSASKKDLLRVESRNFVRSAAVVKFVKAQMQKFRAMGAKIMANQLKYTQARRKIWMENDQLNRMEHQKVYEQELRAYALQFQLVKRQLDKNFRRLEQKGRRYAQRVSEKILQAQLKKYSSILNREYRQALQPDYESFWAEEVAAMRATDFAHEKAWQEDLRLAGVAAAKFV